MEGGGSMTARRAVQQILLCGFMGCGKTSVGQALAFRLRWDFLDTDALIEKRTGMSIPEIFAKQGEQSFRQMEQQAAAMLGKRRHTVVSTGGGFLTREQTVQALRQNGGFDMVLITKDGQVLYTPGLADRLTEVEGIGYAYACIES